MNRARPVCDRARGIGRVGDSDFHSIISGAVRREGEVRAFSCLRRSVQLPRVLQAVIGRVGCCCVKRNRLALAERSAATSDFASSQSGRRRRGRSDVGNNVAAKVEDQTYRCFHTVQHILAGQIDSAVRIVRQVEGRILGKNQSTNIEPKAKGAADMNLDTAAVVEGGFKIAV